MKASYFIPMKNLMNFMAGAAMNNQEGIQLFGVTDPKVRELIPSPLELQDPEAPVFCAYIVNIREPTFAPWYMEGGIGLLAKYGNTEGIYFLNFQLSGPGALMGAFSGREGSGLPKKLCEKIVVYRMDDYAHCYIERKGVRLIDVELTIGQYNDPGFSLPQDVCIPGHEPVTSGDGCLLHKYSLSPNGFSDMELVYYDSSTRFKTWEKASASVKLASSVDDPWGEIPVVSILGAGWMVSDNWVNSLTTLYRYPGNETLNAMQYLFSGRYDQCTLCSQHQEYG